MKQLSFKTRGNTSPHGKPKVYFCHHPADFDLYFREIAEDILAISDCAVCYYSGEGEMPDKKAQEATLSQMRLIVLPITANLLTQPSGAMEFELVMARKHKVPLLPLVQESGLEELFKHTFGDTQYLDKRAQDDTAISYQEKLKKHLESLLISDTLTQRVRGAFAAYIFLSYRKKDRQLAQELMNLIHRNDFCRDIAIWYDEFLIPGENFNNAIKAAIQKSHLFALAVTPNLLEKENYVLTQEYPHAKKLDKPVLAVELLPTDHGELKALYNIVDLVDAKNDSALSEKLLKILGDLDAKKEKKEPTHTYLIGLAYLGGIDVERSPEKAKKLITQAAEAGLYEAIEKLARMYLDGDSVDRDPAEAINLLTKLARLDKERYENAGRKAYGFEYFHRLWELGNVCFDAKLLEKAQRVYSEMRDVAEALMQTDHRQSALRCLVHSYTCLGRVYYEQGKKQQANRCHQKAMKLAVVFNKNTNTESSRILLANCYSNLADSCYYVLRIGLAKRCYQKALTLWKTIAEDSNTTQARLRLAEAYDEVANLSPFRAKKYYLEARDIREALMDEENSDQVKLSLSDSYSNLGYLCAALGEKEEAQEYYRKAIALLEAENENKQSFVSKYNLANLYYNYGSRMKNGTYLEKALRIYMELDAHYPGLWYLENRKKLAEKLFAEVGRSGV